MLLFDKSVTRNSNDSKDNKETKNDEMKMHETTCGDNCNNFNSDLLVISTDILWIKLIEVYGLPKVDLIPQ